VVNQRYLVPPAKHEKHEKPLSVEIAISTLRRVLQTHSQ